MIQTIDVTTLQTWLSQGQSVSVLDVRPEADWQEWSIPQSVHAEAYHDLKAGQLAPALQNLNLPQNQPIVTVCGMGKMSLVAAEQLQARGYQVYSLAGGMQAWSLAWNSAQLPTLANGTEIIQIRRTGKGCLSYLIGSQGQALVIDASLDPAVYLQLAQARGWQLQAVLDTHIHADHLSRSRQLAELSGATFYLPANQRNSGVYQPISANMQIQLGAATIQALATPGHTWESMSYLLDGSHLFSGDTLFLAAVGRPDLEAQAAEAQQRASALYQSLQTILALDPASIILPGHTSKPVAFDGVPIMASLAEVQTATPRLAQTEAEFVAGLTAVRPATPPNHQTIVQLNQAGAALPDDLITLEAGANRCAIA
ncbi:MAG TPA: MBL fold metallo-hydrolase [Herpetosiphon sp.]|uniref:Beta-lactamase domain protein n=1 Tax=Herpetosiphon aurantiacus (strain ATCC 23779 / DSM 785 / 114-95) TaxID=316274 RepID=A9B7Y8_HERA2|nr:rhodanese-like domain-containing protein [Herpetosiphon sp.]ABX05921.1 beta-lactamase domain protein [Herpetosiphon aurantiacus DSM 785]HBW51569.1 MBL fold metallo-hydrolase [Herpetosiphon sp.]